MKTKAAVSWAMTLMVPAMFVAGCGTQVVRLEVTPMSILMEVGETDTLWVDAVTSDGRHFVPVQTLAFSVDDPSVLTVDRNGNAAAGKIGETTLRIDAHGFHVDIPIQIVAAGSLETLEDDELIDLAGEAGGAAQPATAPGGNAMDVDDEAFGDVQ